MDPFSVMAGDLASLACELGTACPQIRWNGKDYKIFPNSTENNQPLRSGGFSFAYDFNFTATVKDFLTDKWPTADALVNALLNTKFTYLGADYKFVTIAVLTGATVINCNANALNEGA